MSALQNRGIRQVVHWNDTPASAAQFLLNRIGRIRAIQYAQKQVGGDTIRGRTFWQATLEIVQKARETRGTVE